MAGGARGVAGRGAAGAPGSHGDGREQPGPVFSRTACAVLRDDVAARRGRGSSPTQGRQRPQWDGGCLEITARAGKPSAPRLTEPEPGRLSHPDDSRAGNPLPATRSPPPPPAQGLGHQRRNCVCWENAQGRKPMRPNPAWWGKRRFSHRHRACLRGKQRQGEEGGFQGCPPESLLPEPGFSLNCKLKFFR